MRTKNFPYRKHLRRQRAVNRATSVGGQMEPVALDTTISRLDKDARGIRTKKRRGA